MGFHIEVNGGPARLKGACDVFLRVVDEQGPLGIEVVQVGHFFKSHWTWFAMSQPMAVDDLPECIRETAAPGAQDVLLEVCGVDVIGIAEHQQIEARGKHPDPVHCLRFEADQQGVPGCANIFECGSICAAVAQGRQERLIAQGSTFQLVKQSALGAVPEFVGEVL